MPVITDEHVQKALNGYYGPDFIPCGDTALRMKCALDAAMNPPAEPEIVVTEEMCDAGFKAYFDMALPSGQASITAAYRAMRRLEVEPKTGGTYVPEVKTCDHSWWGFGPLYLTHPSQRDYRCAWCGKIERKTAPTDERPKAREAPTWPQEGWIDTNKFDTAGNGNG